jgi:uncharacterized protein
MAILYFDSSAVAKRYLLETGTIWIRDLTDPGNGHDCYLAAINGVEVVSAVARQHRNGALSASDAARVITEFRHHLDHEYRIIGVSSILIAHAMALAETHALRGYDAVQLAAALEVYAQCLAAGTVMTLISSDTALNLAAMAEGLTVDDPNSHP